MTPAVPNLPTSPPLLEKPIAIPALSPSLSSPFLRAYAPVLDSFSISKATFLHFVDTLNLAAAEPAPLTALSLVGDVLGFVPEPVAQVVGMSTTAIAEISSGLIMYGRTEVQLQRANAEIFGPKGLKVEITKLDVLAKMSGMPILDERGRIDKAATLLRPLDELEGCGSGGSLNVSEQQRILGALKPWIAELEFLPPAEIEALENIMERLHMKINDRVKVRREKRLLEKRKNANDEYHSHKQRILKDFEKEIRETDRDMQRDTTELDADIEKARKKSQSEKIARLERKRQGVLVRYEKKKMKKQGENENDMREIEKDVLCDDEEKRKIRRILWLTVRNKTAPSGNGLNLNLPLP